MVTMEKVQHTGPPHSFRSCIPFQDAGHFVTRNSADMDFALTLWQQYSRDNEVYSSLSVGQFLVVCLMVSLLLYDILKLNFL
jgi:hypothetical protein